MGKSKTRISKLRVNEVSLVDRPANPAARVVLAKRDEEDVEKGMKCSSCGAKGVYEKGQCYKCSVSKAMEYNAVLDVSVGEILDDESLDSASRSEHLSKTIDEYRDSILALVNGQSDAPAIDAISKQENDNMAEITKADVEQLLKGASDEQMKAVEALLQKQAEAQKELIEKAQKDAATAREEIAKRDRLAKAATMVGDTPIAAADLATVLEKAGDNADVTAFIGDLLTKYAAAMKAGRVLDELGSARGTDVTKAANKLETAVAELQKAQPKLSYAQAYEIAIKNNPALYDEIVAGR